MTYATGQVITAADFMSFRGDNAYNVAYADASAATNKIAALIGVGYGNRGYGQVADIAAVVPGNTIVIDSWNQLFAAMSTINTHTGSGLTLPANVSSGNLIEALTGSGGDVNLTSLISTLDTNRLTAAVGQMALTAELSSVKSVSWFTQINHEFTVTYSSENLARYFFNSGGQLYISASRSGRSSTPLNTSITNMLSSMGTIKVAGETASYTGSGATLTPLGYNDLTTTYQTILEKIGIIGYGYTAPSYTLQARVENVLSVNGGNGSRIRFNAIIATNMDSSETVDGTIISAVSQYKATGGVLTIAAPTYTTTSAL